MLKKQFKTLFILSVIMLLITDCSESFTDIRDNQNYKLIQIGNKKWMAENLNFTKEESYCPENDSKKCIKFGRLYSWHSAQTACPNGFYLPSLEDYKSLIFEAKKIEHSKNSGKILKATRGWFKKGNGTDRLGFRALPAGYKKENTLYDGIGGYAYFWTSSEDSEGLAYYLFLDFSNNDAQINSFIKNEARSVRCIQK